MFTVGLGLFGATVIILAFQNTASTILIGFGGSRLALFLRVGGGIFTKAADVGADLVGKVEAGIPEDDPRNLATIADNVGDNVGDCAGMAADLFESHEVTLVASIILGVAAFNSIGANPALGLIFPVVVRAIGVLASIVGVYAVRATPTDRSPLTPINRGFATAGVLTGSVPSRSRSSTWATWTCSGRSSPAAGRSHRSDQGPQPAARRRSPGPCAVC